MPTAALPGVGDERTSAALHKFRKYWQDREKRGAVADGDRQQARLALHVHLGELYSGGGRWRCNLFRISLEGQRGVSAGADTVGRCRGEALDLA